MKVQDCMCQDIYCIKPETKIGEAAKLMSEHHVGCLPVCDNNNSICGIVTDRDLVLRCIACDKDVKQTPISDIMTCDVSTCKKTDDITNAESNFSVNTISNSPELYSTEMHILGKEIYSFVKNDLAKLKNKLR